MVHVVARATSGIAQMTQNSVPTVLQMGKDHRPLASGATATSFDTKLGRGTCMLRICSKC